VSTVDDINRLVYAVVEANKASSRERGEDGVGDVYVIPARLWFRVQDALRPSLTKQAAKSEDEQPTTGTVA